MIKYTEEQILGAIKLDLGSTSSIDLYLSYSILDDGTLAVFEHEESGNIAQVRVVHISLGKELTKEEWGNP